MTAVAAARARAPASAASAPRLPPPPPPPPPASLAPLAAPPPPGLPRLLLGLALALAAASSAHALSSDVSRVADGPAAPADGVPANFRPSAASSPSPEPQPRQAALPENALSAARTKAPALEFSPVPVQCKHTLAKVFGAAGPTAGPDTARRQCRQLIPSVGFISTSFSGNREDSKTAEIVESTSRSSSRNKKYLENEVSMPNAAKFLERDYGERFHGNEVSVTSNFFNMSSPTVAPLQYSLPRNTTSNSSRHEGNSDVNVFQMRRIEKLRSVSLPPTPHKRRKSPMESNPEDIVSMTTASTTFHSKSRLSGTEIVIPERDNEISLPDESVSVTDLENTAEQAKLFTSAIQSSEETTEALQPNLPRLLDRFLQVPVGEDSGERSWDAKPTAVGSVRERIEETVPGENDIGYSTWADYVFTEYPFVDSTETSQVDAKSQSDEQTALSSDGSTTAEMEQSSESTREVCFMSGGRELSWPLKTFCKGVTGRYGVDVPPKPFKSGQSVRVRSDVAVVDRTLGPTPSLVSTRFGEHLGRSNEGGVSSAASGGEIGAALLGTPPPAGRGGLRQLISRSLVRNDERRVTGSGAAQGLLQTQPPPGPTERVSVLGLFELTTRRGVRLEGHSELAAAQMAVRHVNERGVLPGFHLELHTNDTKCDPGVGVDAFFHALYTQNTTRTVMLLGSACSDVTESLAKVVPYWNIVQVSFGSTSPALSDRKEFPLFYRTVAPDSSHNPARLAFVRGFGWDTVAALSQNEDVYSLAVNDLVTELEQANITCSATITFAESDFEDQMRMLRDLDTRIIIGSFSQQVAPKIFCEAHRLGMFGGDYAWILQGGPDSRWWRNASAGAPCPAAQLAAAVEGLLLVSAHNRLVGSAPAISGMTNARFLEEFSRRALPVSPYAPQTYDAVWAIALTLRAAHQRWAGATSVRHFDYSRRDMAHEFLRQMGRLSFLGVSGPVSFSGADRVGISAFYQVQGGEVVTVALFDPATGALDFGCPGCGALAWQGGQVPVARREFRLRVVTIEPAAFLSVACLAVVGISLAVAFLAFNLHFRKLKYIKLSSPRLNNMAVVGCILVYTAVILLGLDHATLPATTHFPAVCTARVYLLSAGFSLAFGSMFTKTYRVHRIFTRSRSGVVKNKLLQDTQLISLICVLLLIDGLIVTLWVTVDPIQRHLRNLTLEISASDRSVVYQPQVEVCRSQYTHSWLGALYAYKGLLLVVGVYMAWETRHVKIPALNDSQYIGMSVYSVVITSGIVVVLANLISERATLAFVTITALILTSTTATLCLLFLPKMLAILGRAAHADPIVESMGLKIECNTRRFVTDDRRELYYRVEVQNRVYRREVAALDLEIGRLKRQLLDSPAASSAGSTSSVGTKRGELSPLEATALARLSIDDTVPNPAAGVGGGLPLLLLSVLPPVIPRASWPSADRGPLPMRRQVTFSSEPKLDDSSAATAAGVCSQPAPAHYDDVASFDHDGDFESDVDGLHAANRKQGVFGRIWSFLGSSRPSSRKASATSFGGGGGGAGIASALRLHMGYLSGLVAGGPAAQHGGSGTSTRSHSQCALGPGMVPASSRELHPLKKLSSAGLAAGGSGPIISVTSNDDAGDDAGRRKFSLGMCLARDLEGAPVGGRELLRRSSGSASPRPRFGALHQHSQPNLPFRERARGSPRFPHRVVPACSLNALDSRRKSSASLAQLLQQQYQHQYQAAQRRRSSHHHHLHVRHGQRADLLDKCRSLEDARSCHRGSAAAHAAFHQVPGSNWKPRAASYSPNCDVWGTAEFGIPLSELANSNRGRDRDSAPNVKD